jgi:phosphoribosylanthranilate isomerase
MTRVKICSITTEADRDAAVAAGADALGFIVDVPVDTRRELDPATAADLIDGVPPFVTSVLVTMPDTLEQARRLLAETGADAIQLHNDHPPAAFAEFEHPVLKRIPPEVEAARTYAPVVDALVVDSIDETGAGGTGHAVDRAAARAVREVVDVPVVLAGGLGPDNVADAIAAVQPFAVDVSSGVEETEGRKDHRAVAEFVAAANRTSPRASP